MAFLRIKTIQPLTRWKISSWAYLGTWHWFPMTASLPSCPAKTGTCILPLLGSSCQGCAGPDVQASLNPWESPSWHLDSLLPWPNSRMDSAIWDNCGCDICNICQRMVLWCGQDWFQSPTLPLPDWASCSFSASLSVKWEYQFLIHKVFLRMTSDNAGKTLYGESNYILST